MSNLSHNDPPCFRPGSLIAPLNKFCSFSIVATHTSLQTRFNLTFLKLADLHFYLRTYKKLSQPNFSTSYVAALFCPFACSAGSGKSIQDEPIRFFLLQNPKTELAYFFYPRIDGIPGFFRTGLA